MAAAVNYLKSLNRIHGIDEFEEKLFNLLQENPNTIANVEEMESAWNELKLIIHISVNDNSLGEEEVKHLNEIASGHLEFTRPSAELYNILTILKAHKFSDNALSLLSSQETEYLIQLLQFLISKKYIYLSQYGTPDETKFNSMFRIHYF